MSKDILRIDPYLSIHYISDGVNIAQLQSDPEFRDRFLELLKIVNDKYQLCEVSQSGPHETTFTYIPGVNRSKITVTLSLLKIIVDLFHSDLNLAWMAGADAVAQTVFECAGGPPRDECGEVTDRVLKLLIDQTLSNKAVDVKFIQNRYDAFASVKKCLFDIKDELERRKKFYHIIHPKMKALVDEHINAVVSAEKAYKEATKSVILYNDTLVEFLKKELLSEASSYVVIQSVVDFLGTYWQDNPCPDYIDCLGVISKAETLVYNYRGNPESSYVDPDF